MADSKYDVLIDIAANVKGNAQSQLASIGNAAGTSTLKTKQFGSAMSTLKGMLGAEIIIAGFRAIGNSIEGAVQRFDTLKTADTVLTSMGESAGKAAASTQDLVDGIDGLPTALDDVVNTRNQFALLGKTTREATDLTLALNNAFIASGSSTADASRGLKQYTQMLANGKADLQSWKTLNETMGPALTNVATEMLGVGKNAMDLYGALKTGEVSFDQFSEAIVRANERGGEGFLSFEERAKMMSNTVQGAWTNVGIAVERNIQLIMSAMTGVTEVKDDLSNLGEVFDPLINSTEDMSDKLAFMNQNLHTNFDSFAEMKKAVEDGTVSVGDFNLVLGQSNPNVFVEALNGIRGAIDWLGEGIAGGIKAFQEWWGALGDEEKLKYIDLLGAFLIVLAGVILGALVPALWAAVVPMLPWIALILALTLIVFGIIWVIQHWGEITEWIGDLHQKIKDKIHEAWDNMWQAIKDFGQRIKDDIKEKWQAIKDFLSNIVDNIKQAIRDKWQQIKDNISEKMDNIKQDITDKWTAIKEFIPNTVQAMKDAAVQKFEDMKNAIADVFNRIKQKIEDVWNSVKDTVAKLNPFKMEVPVEFATSINGSPLSSLGGMNMALGSRDFDLGNFNDVLNMKTPKVEKSFVERRNQEQTIVLNNELDFSMDNVQFRQFTRDIIDVAKVQGLI